MKKKNILILLLFTLIAILPLINNKIDAGDSWFHLANIKSLAETINLKNPLGSQIRNYYGYGTGIFYPPLAHYIGALLFLIFKPLGIIFTYKLEQTLILFLSGLSMYYVLDKIYKKEKTKLIGSVLWITFPYHLNTIIVRGALAEQLTFIFVPIILLSLYYLFKKEYIKFMNHFIMGFTLMIYSHLVMSVYLALFVLIILLVNIKKINKQSIKYLFLSSLFILVLILPFIVPLIDNLSTNLYVISKKNTMATNETLKEYSLRLYDYLSLSSNGQILYLDLITLFFFLRSLKRKNKFYEMCLIFAILPFIMTLNIFPWNIMPESLKMIQFPYRLLIFVNIPIIIGAALEMDKKWLYIIILTTIITGINADMTNYTYNKEDILGWQKEYLPVATLENFKPDTSNYLYYKGYTLYDEDNNEINYTISNNGFINPEKEFTKIKFNKYNYLYFISIIGGFLLIFYNFFQKTLEKSYDI